MTKDFEKYDLQCYYNTELKKVMVKSATNEPVIFFTEESLKKFIRQQIKDYMNNTKETERMKYRKKPVEVKAIQLTENNMIEVLSFCNYNGIIASSENNSISINTLEGTITANIGDYIIKGIKGEIYPCKPDIFEQTYDKIEEL